MKLIIGGALGLLFTSSLFGIGGQRFENLKNPTQYLFSVPKSIVIQRLREVHGARSWGPLSGAYFEESGLYRMDIDDFYTSRYWTGRRERREEVNPPEAGRIGGISADFDVSFEETENGKTLVVVKPSRFEQQVGRSFRVLPHFQKVPVSVEVRSDTYFEYLFLLRLGELLGEKGMPAIKGRDD